MNKIDEIIAICTKIDKLSEFQAHTYKTHISMTIILVDLDAHYIEHAIIDLSFGGPTVYIVDEGFNITELSLDKYHANFIENWSEYDV